MIQIILIIDTANNSQTVVGLKIDSRTYWLKENTQDLKSQNLLPMIDKILKKYRISSKELTGIKVNTGPGSFTGLKVGVAVANTLGWTLGIPVNGENKPVQPIYK